MKINGDTLALFPLDKISKKIIFNKKRKSFTYFKKFDKIDYRPSNYDSLSFSFNRHVGEKRINYVLIINSIGEVSVNDNIKFVAKIQNSLNEKMKVEFDSVFKNDYNKYYVIYNNSIKVVTTIYVKNLSYKMILPLTSFSESMISYFKSILSQTPKSFIFPSCLSISDSRLKNN